jgi:hypothetical protein
MLSPGRFWRRLNNRKAGDSSRGYDGRDSGREWCVRWTLCYLLRVANRCPSGRRVGQRTRKSRSDDPCCPATWRRTWPWR